MSKYGFKVVAFDQDVETIDDLLLKMDSYESRLNLQPQVGYYSDLGHSDKPLTFIN